MLIGRDLNNGVQIIRIEEGRRGGDVRGKEREDGGGVNPTRGVH